MKGKGRDNTRMGRGGGDGEREDTEGEEQVAGKWRGLVEASKEKDEGGGRGGGSRS